MQREMKKNVQITKKPNFIDEHKYKYQDSKERIEKLTFNIEEYLDTQHYLENHKIDCFKYNTTLDDCA